MWKRSHPLMSAPRKGDVIRENMRVTTRQVMQLVGGNRLPLLNRLPLRRSAPCYGTDRLSRHRRRVDAPAPDITPDQPSALLL
jgi:hypothetical protein